MRRVSFPVPYLIQIVSMWPTGLKALRQVQIHTEAESAKCLDQTKILLLFFWLQFARWSGGSEDQLVVAFDSAGKHACRSLVSQWNLARCRHDTPANATHPSHSGSAAHGSRYQNSRRQTVTNKHVLSSPDPQRRRENLAGLGNCNHTPYARHISPLPSLLFPVGIPDLSDPPAGIQTIVSRTYACSTHT
jgi:hypothetical protein